MTDLTPQAAADRIAQLAKTRRVDSYPESSGSRSGTSWRTQTFDRPPPMKPSPLSVERTTVDQVAYRVKAAKFPDRHLARAVADEHDNSQWCDKFAKVTSLINKGSLLIFCGPNGNGKTQMGVSLGLVVCRSNRRVRYVKGSGYIDALTATYGGGDGPSTETVKDRFSSYDLLIWDEAHVALRSDHQTEESRLLIDRRYDAKRTTILITNTAPEALDKVFGTYLTDRANECGGVVEFDWPSFRSHQR
ncbi:MAG: ATP-binding protein [Planctomycetota bacterium]